MNCPIKDGRVYPPYTSLYESEGISFLPGDKVRDRRDNSKRTWRIVARVAFEETEKMTLRDVNDDSNEWNLLARDIIPHLEMVAKSI